MRYAALAAATLGLSLAACGGDHVKQVASAGNTVSYTIQNDDEEGIAERRAEDYCQRYFGYPAVRLADIPERPDRTLQFACKGRS